MNKDKHKETRDWIALVFGLFSTVVAVTSVVQSCDAQRVANIAQTEALSSHERSISVKVEVLLNDAWDLLGGQAATNVITLLSKDQAKIELARRKIDEAIILAPNSAKAYRYKAIYFESVGLKDKALEAYKNSINLDPSSAPTYVNLGIALLSQGKHEAALNAYKKASTLGADEVIVQLNLASLYNEMGMTDDAKLAQKIAKGLIEQNHARFDSELVRRVVELDFARPRPIRRSVR